ncbi:MAG: hypothetical protein ACYDCQ_05240 [Dehalococcoidia bacterium]
MSMSDSTATGASPIARSFAEHVRSFHAGLPQDEQKLLEKVFAMAEAAAASGDDVQGYAAVDYFLKIEGIAGSNWKAGQPPSNLWKHLGGLSWSS